MHVFQTTDYLINNVLFVNFFEDVRSNDCVQVSLHVLEHYVYIAIIFGTNYVNYLNDILMV